MLDEHASIYGLKDQRNGEIFYIGMSTDPYSRYGEHLSLRGKVRYSAKGVRILDMRKDGLIPELVILEEDIPIKQAFDHEQYWIHFYLEQGIVLTNIQHAHSKKNQDRDLSCFKYSLSDVHGVYEHACRVLAKCDICNQSVECDDCQEIKKIRDKWLQIEKVMLWKQQQS